MTQNEKLAELSEAGVVAQRTGRDGRVSLEVSPAVTRDTDATAAEAAHLWWLVDLRS
jgi:transaldolase